jgi:peptidoglycan/xylan/chitin deacetylase (PgdA/CDA1 family)
MFYFKRNPFLLRQWHKKSLLWQVNTKEKSVYLTFDDGPTPELTLQILEILRRFQVQATFFCVGENVMRYPALFQKIIDEGHGVGNHSFNHLNAWKIDAKSYIANVNKAAEYIPSRLFRPPYGKISPGLIKQLKTKYKLVMWTVLSADFDPKVDANQAYYNAISHTKKGDIIVFHDNLKAEKKVLEALPRTLLYFQKQGIKVMALPD